MKSPFFFPLAKQSLGFSEVPKATTTFPFISPDSSTPVMSEAGRIGSRRQKLWEINHKFHCPLIGVCFDCDELRALMSRVLDFPKNTSDFVLHTTAVSHCAEKSELCRLLHKTLDKRYALTIKQFSRYKSATELQAHWIEAVRHGMDVPAVLWALWSHPACDQALAQTVYGEIHMIQHQVGAGTRADLHAMKRLRTDHQQLQQVFKQCREQLESLKEEHARSSANWRTEEAKLRNELIASHTRTAHALGEAERFRRLAAGAEQQAQSGHRHATLKEENRRLEKIIEEQAGDIKRLREFANYAESLLETLAGDEAPSSPLPAADLSGKCVLCVGGRAGTLSAYREIVEQSGGRFLHHDGGLEESLHRMDGVLAAADIVICQAACISHNAYWRVKDVCKRTGKPCMFVKGTGVTRFGQVIQELGQLGEAPAGPQNTNEKRS